MKIDLVIIGGGPAGLAAAIAAKEAGIDDLIIVERDKELGGILNQCIHNGFGLHTFREELTGTEYAQRYIKRVKELQIPYMTSTMVVDISKDKTVTVMSRDKGMIQYNARAVILAMGCRERSRGALNIPGYRPAGIFSAGTAQYYVNCKGKLPGKEIVILGSGDIGLIMARRMTLEGAKVKLVAEIMPYSGGLQRNIVQCLEDFQIPLLLSHTVVDIDGTDRVKGVTIAQVDEHLIPISGTEEYVACDTLLLSVGLIPENELTTGMGAKMDEKSNGPVVTEELETSVEGVFACGNVLHVHDLVDHVSQEAAKAGAYAAAYLKNENSRISSSKILTFTSPRSRSKILKKDESENGKRHLICIGCPMGCELTVSLRNQEITVTGNTCKRGEDYAKKEVTDPRRIVTSSVCVKYGNLAKLPVKTRSDIPKGKIKECMRQIKECSVTAPIAIGQVIIRDVAKTGVDVIATKELVKKNLR